MDMAVGVFVGRLVRDAELKYTNSGIAVCKFTLATNAKRKQGDQWVDEASYWVVDLWGKPGESVCQYLTKGKVVAVEGTLRQEKYESNGQERMKVVVNANSVNLISQNPAQESTQNRQADINYGQRQNNQNTADSNRLNRQAKPAADDFMDEIPF